MSLLLLSGCGSSQDTAGQYSNLTDVATQKVVTKALEDSGVSAKQTWLLTSWINDFNGLVKNYTLAGEFQPMPEDGMDYSALLLDDTAEPYAYQQWLNCRIAAFAMIQDVVSTAGTGTDMDSWLMFDVEAIDTMPQLMLEPKAREDFLTVFNQIPVSGDLTNHSQQIQQAWQDRKITLSGEGISLVCVYLHYPEENVRFVGHAGVLLQTPEGLLFVEKYSPLAPFQATRFADQRQLKEYLLARPDFYGGEELKPIVTINGSGI